MPPGPAYNWFCVLYSTVEILSYAARHRATQIVPRSTSVHQNSRKRRRTEETAPLLATVDHACITAEEGFGPVELVNDTRKEGPGPKSADELTNRVQPIIQDTNISPPAFKSAENATNTVQVQSQYNTAVEIVHAPSIIQDANTQTVYFNFNI